MSGENVIPKGYKQTEVGVIPEDWEIHSFGDLVNYRKGFAFKSKDYQPSGVRVVRVSDTSFSSILDSNSVYISSNEADKYKAWALKENDLIFSTVGSKPPMYDSLVGKAVMVSERHNGSLLNQNAVRIRAISPVEGIQTLLLNHFRTERYIDFIEVIYRGNANQASITLENLFEFKIPLPRLGHEQTAIATALSDMDALIREQEKLIAKKQAIKTATMQQLLTGRTRLPEFATWDNGKKKGYQQTELGEVPEDWEVVPFGALFEPSITRKALLPNDSVSFISMQDVSEGAKLISHKIIQYSEIKSGFTYFERGDVLVAKITPCFENGKGCFTESLETDVGFGSTEFHVLRAVEVSDSKFIYFWTTRSSFRSHLESEMVGSAGHRRVPFTAIRDYIIGSPRDKQEQTAIATILSDMDNDIQTLQQRLAKTRQIKQGMMQELLTGKTRLVDPRQLKKGRA